MEICQSNPAAEERVRSGKADYHTWSDLAELGDKSAVHKLIDLLEQIGTKGPLTSDETLDDNFSQIAMTLGDLKAREAVPVLLRYVEYPEIITCLEQIGDGRATPALKKIVEDNGRILRDGLAVHPKFEQERLFAARLALAQFDPANAPLRLGELLADPDRFHRSNVLDRLENLTDPRTIPFLVNVFKTDTDHWILRRSIRDLGRRKYKAAVAGLIACFDRKFKEEHFGKGEHVTPQTYPNQIAHSLQQITGETFGRRQTKVANVVAREGPAPGGFELSRCAIRVGSRNASASFCLPPPYSKVFGLRGMQPRVASMKTVVVPLLTSKIDRLRVAVRPWTRWKGAVPDR